MEIKKSLMKYETDSDAAKDVANKASDDKTKDVYFETTKRIKLRNNSIAENSDISQFKPHELSCTKNCNEDLLLVDDPNYQNYDYENKESYDTSNSFYQFREHNISHISATFFNSSVVGSKKPSEKGRVRLSSFFDPITKQYK